MIAAACGGVLSLALVAGCGPHPAGKSSPKASASPKPATPLPIAVAAHDLDATIFDRQGKIVATVKAAAASAGPDKKPNQIDPIGAATNASAVLYQNGKPTATMQATTLRADRDARTVVGAGSVTLRSLTQPDSPAIRADTMTWKYGEDHVVGRGHVLVTRKPDMQLPGESFVADTQIKTFTLQGNADSAPAKRTLPTPANHPQ